MTAAKTKTKPAPPPTPSPIDEFGDAAGNVIASLVAAARHGMTCPAQDGAACTCGRDDAKHEGEQFLIALGKPEGWLAKQHEKRRLSQVRALANRISQIDLTKPEALRIAEAVMTRAGRAAE